MSLFFQWTATIISLIGAVFNLKKNRWGFAIWFVGGFFWIAWGFTHEPISWGFIIVQVIFTCINVYGFREWSRDTGTPPTGMKGINE